MVTTAAKPTLDVDGYTIIDAALDAGEIANVRDALAPHLAGGPHGRNDFEGFETQRVYCLVAKSRAFDRLILDRRILDIADEVLGPNFLLTATLAINLLPGETAQSFHHDDTFYRLPRPRPPVSLSVMWALDDFTADNGATLIFPASHTWGEGRLLSGRAVAATMRAGSALVYLGTLVHAGGANTTTSERLGVSIQYCAAWARQQENFTLALGVAGARPLPPRLQELIGYSIHPPFMGMINGLHPRRLLE